MVCGRMDTESTGVDRSGVVLVVSGYTNLTGNMNLIISFWCRNNCHGADPIAGSTGLPVSYPPHPHIPVPLTDSVDVSSFTADTRGVAGKVHVKPSSSQGGGWVKLQQEIRAQGGAVVKGWWALFWFKSWPHRTVVCWTNTNNSTNPCVQIIRRVKEEEESVYRHRHRHVTITGGGGTTHEPGWDLNLQSAD